MVGGLTSQSFLLLLGGRFGLHFVCPPRPFSTALGLIIMEHSGRLFIKTDGGKSYYLWNGTEAYYDKLRSAFIDIQNDEIKDYTLVSFFTLCSATLEYSLNYILADYCLVHYGPENCKKYIEGYINLSFAKKLLLTPSVISNGELQFNEDKQTFKKLNEMINLRNKVMHSKEFVKEFEFPSIEELEKSKDNEFKLNIFKNPIDKFTKEDCLEYAVAIGEFKKNIMESWFNKKLTKNDLLIETKPNKK